MIQIDRITTFDRVRQADRKQVEALAESIREVGLLNPIAVAPDGEGYALIAGMHRLEAARLLGWAEIPATVLALDQHRRIIAECDENLCAPSLTAAERAEFTRLRKAAYEALHPETVREATLKRGEKLPSRQVGETGPAPRFTADTAAATGQSERAVQRDAERGEKVSDEALAMIKGTRLDTGRYLDSIKNLSAADQVAKVEADLAPASEAVERRDAPPAEPAHPIAPAEAKARREIAQMTDEAKADEIIALRADLRDEKAKNARLKKERDDLSSRLAEALATDQGRTISLLQKQLQAAKFSRDEAMSSAKRMEYRLKKAEARVKELESMEVSFP